MTWVGRQRANAALALLTGRSDTRQRALLKIHVRRAYIHVELCMKTGQRVLDCCGEHGDLYFLLHFLLDMAGGDVQELAELLSAMVEIQAHEVHAHALALSKRELATMAA
jgi:hypothetical protein